MNMAYKDHSDESGRGRQKYTDQRRPSGDRREGSDRSKSGAARPQRGERGGKPYAYGDDRPRRERVNKPAVPAPALAEEKEPDELPFLIFGRNAVKEAVKAGRSIDKILVQTEPDGSLKEIVALAKDADLVIFFGGTEKLAGPIAEKGVLMYIITSVGINALVELVVAALVTGAAGVALKKARLI